MPMVEPHVERIWNYIEVMDAAAKLLGLDGWCDLSSYGEAWDDAHPDTPSGCDPDAEYWLSEILLPEGLTDGLVREIDFPATLARVERSPEKHPAWAPDLLRAFAAVVPTGDLKMHFET